MLKVASASLTFLLVSGCGQKAASPPTQPMAAPPATTATTGTAADAAAAGDDTVATVTPDATAATEPEVAIGNDTKAAVARAGETYLVWLPAGEGYETSWITSDGKGGVEVVARRAQAALFAGGTLWGVETRYVPHREIDCWEYEAQEEGGPKARPGPKKHVPWLAIKGLAGTGAGQEREATDKVSGQLFGVQPKDGVYTMIGEHWGRSPQLAGSAADVLLVADCDGGFGCGAHGEWGCKFSAVGLGGQEVTIDLEAAGRVLAPETKPLIAEWQKESADDLIEPDVRAVSLLSNGGEPVAEYLYVADVAYASTSGDWGSYTQSRKHVGKVVPELGLAATPALVKAFLADKPKDARFGWSLVPADAAAGLLVAFEDASTLPAPKPADETVEQVADANAAQAKVDEGRKLTRDKRYPEAIAAFDEALKRSSDKLARAWSGRGYAKLLAGDEAGAQSDFDRALGLDDDPKFQAAIYFNLGELAEGRKDNDKAIEAYRKALALNPTDAVKKRLDKLGAP